MSWKDILNRLKDILENLFGGTPTPPEQPPEQPEQPEQPSEPPDEPSEPPDEPPEQPGGRKKKVYDLSLSVTEIRGVLALKYEGADAEGELIIEGENSDFDNPVGKKFVVSGEVKKLIDKSGNDIIGDLQGNTSFGPEDYLFESRDLRYEHDDANAKAVGTANVTLNWDAIENIRVEGGGKGASAILVEKALIAGSGVLRQ